MQVGAVVDHAVCRGRLVDVAIGDAWRRRRHPCNQARAHRPTSPASPPRSWCSSCGDGAAAGQSRRSQRTEPARGSDRHDRHRHGKRHEMNGHAAGIGVGMRDERAGARTERDDGDRCGKARRRAAPGAAPARTAACRRRPEARVGSGRRRLVHPDERAQAVRDTLPDGDRTDRRPAGVRCHCSSGSCRRAG